MKTKLGIFFLFSFLMLSPMSCLVGVLCCVASCDSLSLFYFCSDREICACTPRLL